MTHLHDIFERGGITHIRVIGETERELFQNALLGLAALVRPDVAPIQGTTVKVRAHVHGGTWTETLEKFLLHVIFENEMHNAVFSAMHIIHLSPQEIECELIGKTVEQVEEDILHVGIGAKGIERIGDYLEVEFVPVFS
ncbi:MAG: archease [Candidatus Sungbacteria bacterium]|uniref:Archease n=1 Tax=Candidatus Sungiibacteriota bacterium TaxID=2750080 RepID=A0A9D6QUB3_9BACT|nr:archease [Candidatus Sungbacteria bacterium]